MNNIIKKNAGKLAPFIMGCIMLSGIGCKKESPATTESITALPQITADAKPISFSTNEKVDILLSVFIPCANGGLGEDALLSGPLHILTTFSISGTSIRGTNHFQPQGISGTGAITGDVYHATGITQDEFKGSLINGQYQSTYINNFRIIGQGPGNNYLVHSTAHITYNANGIVTAEVDNFSVDCK